MIESSIKVSGALLLQSLIPTPLNLLYAAHTKKKSVIVGGKDKQAFVMYLVPNQEQLSIEVMLFPCVGDVHSVLHDPIHPESVILCPKMQAEASALLIPDSSKKNPQLKSITAIGKRFFYGHGAYSKDGKLVLLTEIEKFNGKGFITVRDSKSFKPLGEFPSYGSNAHEIILLDDGRTVAIANGGDGDTNRGNISFVDLKSEKLVDQYVIENKELNSQHFLVSKQGQIIVGLGNATRGQMDLPYGLAVGQRGQKSPLKLLALPQEQRGEIKSAILSLSLDEVHGILATTCPTTGYVHLWNLKSESVIKGLQLPNPTGVFFEPQKSDFWFSSFGPDPMTKISSPNLVQSTCDVSTALPVSAHLSIWQV